MCFNKFSFPHFLCGASFLVRFKRDNANYIHTFSEHRLFVAGRVLAIKPIFHRYKKSLPFGRFFSFFPSFLKFNYEWCLFFLVPSPFSLMHKTQDRCLSLKSQDRCTFSDRWSFLRARKNLIGGISAYSEALNLLILRLYLRTAPFHLAN